MRQQYNETGIENLRLAIIEQAVKDYVNAFYKEDEREIKSLDKFFSSPYGQFLSGGVDAGKTKEACLMKAEYKKWRMEHGCGRCKKNCMHSNGEEHYTSVKKGIECQLKK